jgi:hypothetical protein
MYLNAGRAGRHSGRHARLMRIFCGVSSVRLAVPGEIFQMRAVSAGTAGSHAEN